jgi:hypothetical protein
MQNHPVHQRAVRWRSGNDIAAASVSSTQLIAGQVSRPKQLRAPSGMQRHRRATRESGGRATLTAPNTLMVACLVE